MIRATYGQFKPEIARVAGVSGMEIKDARVMAYTNSAIFELMNEGDWPSIVGRLRFKTCGCKITVPSDYDRFFYCTIDRFPMMMQSPWYEFVGYGWDVPPLLTQAGGVDNTAFQLWGQLSGVLDKDDVGTFNDVPSDGNQYFPAVYATVNEAVNGANPFINVQGYDSSNNWIRTQDTSGAWIDGQNITINGNAPLSPTVGAVAISQVTAITKPLTNGNVLLYCQQAGGQNSTFLCTYAPKDTTPFYRRYEVPGLRNVLSPGGTKNHCVLARLRKRYVPITCDSDFLLISNLPALLSMVQGIYYRESKDFQSYQMFKSAAVELMQKEMKSYLGLQRTKPAITFGEGTGVRPDGQYIL